MALYAEKCTSRGWALTAFVAETTGAWGRAAQSMVRKIARARGMRSGEEVPAVSREIWHALTSAVARAIGHQLKTARSPGVPRPPDLAPGSPSAAPSLAETAPSAAPRHLEFEDAEMGIRIWTRPAGVSEGNGTAAPRAAEGALRAGTLGDSGPAAGDLLLACALCQ